MYQLRRGNQVLSGLFLPDESRRLLLRDLRAKSLTTPAGHQDRAVGRVLSEREKEV